MNYIGICESIGYGDYSKRRKKKNEPVNQRFCDLRVSGIAVIAERARANAIKSSVKSQKHGSCGRGGEGERRKHEPKGTSAGTKAVNITGLLRKRTMR